MVAVARHRNDRLRPKGHIGPSGRKPCTPLNRVASLLPFIEWLKAMGVAPEPLLTRAGIEAQLVNYPAAAIPLRKSFHFAELACCATGTEHMGLFVGLETPLDTLGRYGRSLQSAETLGEYLRTGVSLYQLISQGQSLQLQTVGGHSILKVVSTTDLGVGAYQSHLQILAITIERCREAAGPGWSPPFVKLAYSCREPLPSTDLFSESRVHFGRKQTWMAIPQSLLALQLPRREYPEPKGAEQLTGQALQEDPVARVRAQVAALLPESGLTIDRVGNSLGLSTRTLQRELAKRGISFTRVIADARMTRAKEWLCRTDKSVLEIALEVGYTDASNFTRAFRRRNGISPQAYREAISDNRVNVSAITGRVSG